jgi:peptidoglycan/xylan/chitin deacetylase (PgdA/CDA1 family)
MAKRIWVMLASVILILVVGVTLWAEVQAQTAVQHPTAKPVVHGASLPIRAYPPKEVNRSNTPAGANVLPGATQDFSVTTYITVPILMYHHVGNTNTYQTYSVDNAMFEWQMDYLEKQGYHTVSVADIALALTNGAPLPDKPIAITFDDGWVQQITNTLPVLLRHHFQATYYIIVNVTGRRVANMTWDQVRQLRDAGMWIGSHTLSHGYLPGMSDKRLKDELVNSKQILEQQLGIPITTLAYPGGAFNARVERMAHDAGYVAAVTVLKGYMQRADSLYRLQRVGVYGVDTQERFIAKVDQTFFAKEWPFPQGQARFIDPAPEQ